MRPSFKTNKIRFSFKLPFLFLCCSCSEIEEEEIPELEIDVDELLDMETDPERGERVKELLVDCYKPTEAFVSGLLEKIQGMQKLSTPQKK
ncbi:hypothetical protein FKM82_026001 [Ascaphus truei]